MKANTEFNSQFKFRRVGGSKQLTSKIKEKIISGRDNLINIQKINELKSKLGVPFNELRNASILTVILYALFTAIMLICEGVVYMSIAHFGMGIPEDESKIYALIAIGFGKFLGFVIKPYILKEINRQDLQKLTKTRIVFLVISSLVLLNAFSLNYTNYQLIQEEKSLNEALAQTSGEESETFVGDSISSASEDYNTAESDYTSGDGGIIVTIFKFLAMCLMGFLTLFVGAVMFELFYLHLSAYKLKSSRDKNGKHQEILKAEINDLAEIHDYLVQMEGELLSSYDEKEDLEIQISDLHNSSTIKS